MPIIKSAKKALRQSKRHRKFNDRRKKTMKNLIKQIGLLIKDKKTAQAQEMLPAVYQAIDKATKRGIIKKNTAARKKSRLSLLVNKSK